MSTQAGGIRPYLVKVEIEIPVEAASHEEAAALGVKNISADSINSVLVRPAGSVVARQMVTADDADGAVAESWHWER